MKQKNGVRYLGVIVSIFIGFFNLIFYFGMIFLIIFGIIFEIRDIKEENKKALKYQKEEMRITYYHEHEIEFLEIAEVLEKYPEIYLVGSDIKEDISDTYYHYQLTDTISIYTTEQISEVRLLRYQTTNLMKNLEALDLNYVKSDGFSIYYNFIDTSKYHLSFTKCSSTCTDLKDTEVTIGSQYKTEFYQK